MFGTNLKNYRKLSGLSQELLAERLNNLIAGSTFNKDNIAKWEKTTNPKLEVIMALAEALSIPEQFLFDDSANTINKIITKEMPTFKNMIGQVKKITLLDGYAGAGSSGIIDKLDISDYLYVDNNMIKKTYRNEDIKGLTIIGDSMKPYVNCCDIVLFTSLKDGQYNLTDGKYIISTANGVMLKNLSFRANSDIIISSENKAYRDEIIKASESQEILDIIGIVVGRVLKS
jgi:transcriptional regulator with XRE-family HTH domain